MQRFPVRRADIDYSFGIDLWIASPLSLSYNPKDSCLREKPVEVPHLFFCKDSIGFHCIQKDSLGKA